MEIRSTCAHSGEAIALVVDSELNSQVKKGTSSLLVFTPEIDWSRFREPNIIDGY